MAYIIHSNAQLKPSKNSIGNIHGYYGPSDYSAMFDFTHQRFVIGSDKYDFDSVLTLTRASEGAYIDVFGRNKTAAANRPRYSFLESPMVSGLLLESGIENYLNSDEDGASFVAANSGSDLCVSWEGLGSVAPVSSSTLTLRSEVKAMGRTYRFYIRTGAITGTIAITGEAHNICVTNQSIAHTYIPHRVVRAAEKLFLKNDAFNLIENGTGTVVCRFALLPDNGLATLSRQVHMTAYNDNNPRGALRLQTAYTQTGQQTAQVVAHADGADLNVSTQIARVLGNRAMINVVGMYFENHGEKAGVISYLQSNSATAAAAGAVPPTDFTRFEIITPSSGIISGANYAGVILTHCVIYDRMLTDEEALLAASFGA